MSFFEVKACQRTTLEGVSWYGFEFLSISQPENSDVSRYHISVSKKAKNTSKKKRTIKDHNFGDNAHFCEKKYFHEL